jgi:hypothetical protein
MCTGAPKPFDRSSRSRSSSGVRVRQAGLVEGIQVELERFRFDDVGRIGGRDGRDRHLRLAAHVQPRHFVGVPDVDAEEGQRAGQAQLVALLLARRSGTAAPARTGSGRRRFFRAATDQGYWSCRLMSRVSREGRGKAAYRTPFRRAAFSPGTACTGIGALVPVAVAQRRQELRNSSISPTAPAGRPGCGRRRRPDCGSGTARYSSSAPCCQEAHQRARALGEFEAVQQLVVASALLPPTRWRMCSLASSSCVRSSVAEARSARRCAPARPTRRGRRSARRQTRAPRARR